MEIEDKIAEISADYQRVKAAEFDRALEVFNSACESPIEKLMIAALLRWAFGEDGDDGGYILAIPKSHGGYTEFVNCVSSCGNGYLHIWPQLHTAKFRIDVAVGAKLENGKSVMLAVECDGHDFHEKTKTQAASDKSRDRELQSLGFWTLHFTGSEIWNDAIGCARSVLDFIWKKQVEVILEGNNG